jgi:hypothetical protein
LAEQATGVAQASTREAAANESRARHLLAVADLNLAQQALAVNNLGYARRLLDRIARRIEVWIRAEIGRGVSFGSNAAATRSQCSRGARHALFPLAFLTMAHVLPLDTPMVTWPCWM